MLNLKTNSQPESRNNADSHMRKLNSIAANSSFKLMESFMSVCIFFLLFVFINKLCLFNLYIMDVNIQPMLITHKEHPLSIACLFYYSQARSRSLPTAPQKHTQFACSVQFTFSPLPPVTNQTDFISCKFSGFFLFSPIVTCCGYRCGGW